jgi:hypothetical protein
MFIRRTASAFAACLLAFQIMVAPTQSCVHRGNAQQNSDEHHHTQQSDTEHKSHSDGMTCVLAGQCSAPASVAVVAEVDETRPVHADSPETAAATLASVSTQPGTPPPRIQDRRAA